jgi:hypothetical protein
MAALRLQRRICSPLLHQPAFNINLTNYSDFHCGVHFITEYSTGIRTANHLDGAASDLAAGKFLCRDVQRACVMLGRVKGDGKGREDGLRADSMCDHCCNSGLGSFDLRAGFVLVSLFRLGKTVGRRDRIG